MTQEIPLPYDFYIMKTAGIPLLAGCSATDYCKAHEGQHELHSAFLSAIYAFGKETWDTPELQSISYDEIMINFQIDTENELMAVLVYPSHYTVEETQHQARAILDRFIDKFRSEIHSMGLVDLSVFDAFREDLCDLRILPPDLKLIPTAEIQKTPQKQISKRARLLTWLGIRKNN